MLVSSRTQLLRRKVPFTCIGLGLSLAAIGAGAFHQYDLAEARMREEKRKVLTDSGIVGALAPLVGVVIALPVAVSGGDAGRQAAGEWMGKVGDFAKEEVRAADVSNRARWTQYWSSAAEDAKALVAPECRTADPPSPVQCLESTSSRLEDERQRMDRSRSVALSTSGVGSVIALAGVVAAILARRKPRAV